MNKTILVIISLVLFVALVFFYTKTTEQKSIPLPSKKINKITPENIQEKEKHIPMMHPKHTSEPTMEQTKVSTRHQADTHTQTLLYEPLSIEEAKLSTATRKNIIPIGAIRITQSMAVLQPNDTLTLSDVEGEDYTLSIQSIETNNDGSISTTASYEDEGISYTTTITQSEKSTYITLATANGLYEIETRADTGYIYRTDTIRKQLQSRIPNDVIILPIPKGTSNNK